MAQRSPPAETASYLTGLAYAVALLFVVYPINDTVTPSWPLGLDSPSWRYGAIGLGANYVISALFLMLGLARLAALRQHRRILLGVTLPWSGLAALLLLAGALRFLLEMPSRCAPACRATIRGRAGRATWERRRRSSSARSARDCWPGWDS